MVFLCCHSLPVSLSLPTPVRPGPSLSPLPTPTLPHQAWLSQMGSAPSSSGASPSQRCGTSEWASGASKSESRRRQASSSRPFGTQAVSRRPQGTEEENALHGQALSHLGRELGWGTVCLEFTDWHQITKFTPPNRFSLTDPTPPPRRLHRPHLLPEPNCLQCHQLHCLWGPL